MSPVEKRFAILGIILGVGSLAVALGQWVLPNLWRSGSDEVISASQVSRVDAIPNSAVTRLMRSDIIGASLQYVEAVAGPAKYISGPVRIYDAQGCRISIYSSDNITVDSIRVNLSRVCNFYWSDFYEGFPRRDAFNSTIGDISEHGEHRFEFSCYTLCGRSDMDMRFRFLPAGLSQTGSDYVALVGYDEKAFDRLSRYGWLKNDPSMYCVFIRDDGQELIRRAFRDIRIRAVVVGEFFNDNHESSLAEGQLGRQAVGYASESIEEASTPDNKRECLTSPERPT